MIIGNGLLANAFRPHYENNNGVCIFASGVSNSNCTDIVQYKTESLLLEKTLNNLSEDMVFVYFSTCSLYETGSTLSTYKEHKRSMEKFVLNRSKGRVFRLPQIAGNTRNKNTLLNYLAVELVKGKTIKIWKNAKRNIIDVVDVVDLVCTFIEKKIDANLPINIANPQNTSVKEIVEIMSNILEVVPNVDFIDAGSDCDIPISKMIEVLPRTSVKFNDDYLQKILYKYYRRSQILSLIGEMK